MSALPKLPGTNAVVMTPEQAAVADRDWRALRVERDRADAACQAAALAQRWLGDVKRQRDLLITEAVRGGEAAQVARLCGLSRQQVYAIAQSHPLTTRERT